MIRHIVLGCTVLMALSACHTDGKSEDFATPLMRDHALAAESPLDAKLVHWALENFRDETPELISIHMVADRAMRILGHNGPDSMAQGYLRFTMDRAGGDGHSGWQRNLYIPCYKNTDGSYRLARFPNPFPRDDLERAGPFVTATVSCQGVNCSACEIRNIPWASMHCGCERVGDLAGGPSYCNMTITVGLGAVMDRMTEAIPADYHYTPA